MELSGPGRFTCRKEPRCPLFIGLGGAYDRCGRSGEATNLGLRSSDDIFYEPVNGMERDGRDLV